MDNHKFAKLVKRVEALEQKVGELEPMQADYQEYKRQFEQAENCPSGRGANEMLAEKQEAIDDFSKEVL